MLGSYTFVHGDTGPIVLDVVTNVGIGREVLELIGTKTNLPIFAIVCSNHHHTGGARAFAEDSGGDQPGYGHPDVDANRGCVRIHSFRTETLKQMCPLPNVLDLSFKLHLRLDQVA